MRVYLAGPINGCTDEEARGWREDAKRLLEGIAEVSDPMDRDYRDLEHDSALATQLVQQDKEAIRQSHAVLAFPWKESHGTAMEISWAYSLGVHVVVVAPEPQRLSPWIRAHVKATVATLEDAIAPITERFERLRAIGWQ